MPNRLSTIDHYLPSQPAFLDSLLLFLGLETHTLYKAKSKLIATELQPELYLSH